MRYLMMVAVSLFVGAQASFAGPVLCSSADGAVVLTADLQDEGTLESLAIVEQGSKTRPQIHAGTFFKDAEFSLEAAVRKPEEPIYFVLKTQSVNGSLLQGSLTSQVGEVTQTYSVSCVVVFPEGSETP